MSKAKKMPSGNWCVKQYIGDVNGKKKFKSFTAPTRKEAEYLASEYVVKRKEKSKPSKLTVAEAFDKYIENLDGVLSPSSIRGYKQCKRNYLKTIMDIRLEALTVEDVQKAISIDAKRLAPKTVRNAHGLLSAVLSTYLPDIKLKTTLPKKTKTEINIPDHKDFLTLMQMTEGTVMNAVIMIGACLGLRRSEMCALTWDDLDQGNCSVKINKAMIVDDDGNWQIRKKTKSYAGNRGFSIPRAVMEKLLALPHDSDRIIPLTPNAVGDRFIRLRNRLGLKIRLHDLRHYNASVMHALNIPNQYAIRRTGHETEHMLQTVYQHTMTEEIIQADNTINDFFNTLLGKGADATDEEE